MRELFSNGMIPPLQAEQAIQHLLDVCTAEKTEIPTEVLIRNGDWSYLLTLKAIIRHDSTR